jgi:4-phytase / acid phosphatase
MKKRALFLLLGLAIGVPWVVAETSASAEDLPPQGDLVRFVMLSRHGVRAPLQTKEALNQWRKSPQPDWPDFGVCMGYLTAPGAELMTLMGDDYRENPKLLKEAFPGGQCPKDKIFIWSDVDQRTRATAEALLKGLHCSGILIKGDPVPGKSDPCDCAKNANCKKEDPDPLFHPTKSDQLNCRLDPEEVKACGLDGLAVNLNDQISQVQSMLNCCSTELCQKEKPPLTDCKLQNLKSLVEPSSRRSSELQASVKGQLGIAQSFSEILMLEYAQGSEVGFDDTPKDRVMDLLSIHTGVFKVVQRECPEIATRQGSNLLYHMAYAIAHGRDPSESEGDKELIAYIGHDTNIANVAGLLNLHWKLDEYPEDDMPPGGALIFEVRKHSDNQLHVYAWFAAQPPDIMRNRTRGAKKWPVSISCERDGSCTMDAFLDLVEHALDPVIVVRYAKDSVEVVKNDCVTDFHPRP